MNVVRHVRNFFWESPSYLRDRANLISGVTIGITALFLNGAVISFVSLILFSSDVPGYQLLTDHLGFGQVMALILLGGISVFATLLIPLRLATVFLEPRVSRYFDQIVLSGISPLRFVIGKVTSQNLFLGLILFLLLPFFVLSLTLGGVNLSFCLAGLLLVWMYCLSLALATLWLSLYLNELLAACLVIAEATILCVMGSMPLQVQPFVLTPFPVLFQPIYASAQAMSGLAVPEYRILFASCAAGQIAFIGFSLFAIFIGPLYGIIRENSTFGEVVRAGDSKRKRWVRFRLHIQRSSEIAFFYENRSDRFLRYEGLIRWGIGLLGMLVLSAGGQLLFFELVNRFVLLPRTFSGIDARYLHTCVLTAHGVGLALAALLFSHAKNTTYLRLPLLRRITAEVSKLDTASFLCFWAFSTLASIAVPMLFEHYGAVPAGITIFPPLTNPSFRNWGEIDYVRISREGTAIITLAGLAIYACQRMLCLGMWTKFGSLLNVGGLYSVLVVLMPILFGVIVLESGFRMQNIEWLIKIAPTIAAISPLMSMVILFDGRPGHPFPDDLSTTPFYIAHGVILIIALWGIRVAGRKLRLLYLSTSKREATGE